MVSPNQRKDLIPMEKIDHRHTYGIIMDTETANGLEQPLFYDIGWEVIDTNGTIYRKRSFVNSDIFLHEKYMMQSAYYAEKIPNYWREIWTGQRKMLSTAQIHRIFISDYRKFGCKFVMAHNAPFDYRSTNNTQRWVTKSKYRYFIPYGAEVWDTMAMARSVVCKMPTYRKFCEENGYITKNNQLRVTAEILYRFISGENDFSESHTGLEDVDIERMIYIYCKRQHKPMKKLAWGRG